MPHPNNFHGSKLSTAFDDWPCPQEGFSVPTYEYKSWSMDPNLVSPILSHLMHTALVITPYKFQVSFLMIRKSEEMTS
jgi:hypothetical protein